MNLLKEQFVAVINSHPKPEKWVEEVQKVLKKKKIKYSNSGIKAIYRKEYFNEKVALAIIKVLKAEKVRQENLLQNL